ncbi:N-methyl-L-tryptophan oxidase [Planctomicrobium sp. SH661]|uniref:N-methyl-L-tryptophan oxidase n=1 Tax=Planctomicrobium sp. SH661 TaxID=3448124 RepID=UPI003F5BD567
MPISFDCIVVGLGGFGSSALAHLATRGVRVLGIDRFPPAHRFGSSHGRTRIIRKAYFEHPDYVPLLQRAYELWRELEEDCGQPLYSECGLILSGPPDGETIVGARHAAQLHGLQLDSLTRSKAADRFPAFRFPEDHDVAFEPQAGYLRVEDCVLAHLDQAARHGAGTLFGETIRSWSVKNDSVQLTVGDDVIEAGKLIVTAGAWAGGMLAEVLPPLRVLRKVQLWCSVDPEWSDRLSQNPAFYFELPEGAFYGFPSQDGRTLKLAEHTGGEQITDPLQIDLTCRQSDRTPIEEFVKSHLRGVQPRIVDHAACMYTMSPDGHFIIDHHPDHANVILAAGFSGHGFKFTSVIGEALADLAMDRPPVLPMEFLSLSRFN